MVQLRFGADGQSRLRGWLGVVARSPAPPLTGRVSRQAGWTEGKARLVVLMGSAICLPSSLPVIRPSRKALTRWGGRLMEV